jgi:hypothetical protein
MQKERKEKALRFPYQSTSLLFPFLVLLHLLELPVLCRNESGEREHSGFILISEKTLWIYSWVLFC